MITSTRRITVWLLLASLALLVLIFVATGLLWNLDTIQRMGGDFWAYLAAVAQAVTACTVVGAAIFAVRQLQDADLDRNVHMADRLFDSLNTLDCLEARRWVYTHLPADPSLDDAALGIITEGWVEEGQRQVKTVLNSLDHVAFLLQAGSASGQAAIPDDLVMPWMSSMVVKSWQWLGTYVAYTRRARGEEDYYRSVEKLADHCTAWRQKRGLPVKFKAIERTT